MIGCLDSKHDHEGPWASCVRGTATSTTSHSVTGELARHRRTPIEFEDPGYPVRQAGAETGCHWVSRLMSFCGAWVLACVRAMLNGTNQATFGFPTFSPQTLSPFGFFGSA